MTTRRSFWARMARLPKIRAWANADPDGFLFAVEYCFEYNPNPTPTTNIGAWFEPYFEVGSLAFKKPKCTAIALRWKDKAR